MQNFQSHFETGKRLFISAFSICLTVPLIKIIISSPVIRTFHQEYTNNQFFNFEVLFTF